MVSLNSPNMAAFEKAAPLSHGHVEADGKAAPSPLRLGTRAAVFDAAPAAAGVVRILPAAPVDASDVESDAFLEEARRKLATDGFVVLRGLIPRDDVLAARRTVLRAYDARGDVVERASDTLLPGCGAGCVPFTEGRNELTHSDAMLRVLAAPRAARFFERLFGEAALTLDYKWLRGVPRGVATGCHLDRVYMGRGTHRLMTCWIPLGDETPLDLGGLAMLEGSHDPNGPFRKLHATYGAMDVERDGLQGSGWFTEDPLEISARFAPDATWRACATYAAGDAVVFGLGLLHMSTANLTDRVRLSADVRWQPRSEKVDPRYVGAVDAADRVASGARAGAAAAGRVSIGDLKRRWGFAPFVAPV